jgi:hypothetical protein
MTDMAKHFSKWSQIGMRTLSSGVLTKEAHTCAGLDIKAREEERGEGRKEE